MIFFALVGTQKQTQQNMQSKTVEKLKGFIEDITKNIMKSTDMQKGQIGLVAIFAEGIFIQFGESPLLVGDIYK